MIATWSRRHPILTDQRDRYQKALTLRPIIFLIILLTISCETSSILSATVT